MSKRVLVTGTFDILHKGHEFFLKESKKHGDYLIVIVSTDNTLKNIGKDHNNNEKVRLGNVKKLPCVDEAVLGYDSDDKLRIVIEKGPDVICLGYDQHFFTDNLKKKLKDRGLDAEIIRIKSFKPGIYKSSIMRY